MTDSAVNSLNCPNYFNPLPDSNDYLQKLESRLSKVKGLNKEPTSKDMISVLRKTKEDYMWNFVSSSPNNVSLSFEQDQEVPLSYVEKKLFPEKIGVTYEELERLLESDILGKLADENTVELSTDGKSDIVER